MCELFGFTGYQKENLRPMLTEFFSHSVSHPNGWGIARLDNAVPQIEKEPMRAIDSAYLQNILAQDIFEKALFGHIRKATIGSVSQKNCHPYTQQDRSGRIWTLAHNGTVFDFSPITQFYGHVEAETDSACILAYLVSQMNVAMNELHCPLDLTQRIVVLEKLMKDMSPGNKLNLLIYDGEVLYVHTNMLGTLYRHRTACGTVFATVPLDNEQWERVPMTRLLAYKEGKQIFEGTDHGYVYVESSEQRDALNLNYIVY